MRLQCSHIPENRHWLSLCLLAFNVSKVCCLHWWEVFWVMLLKCACAVCAAFLYGKCQHWQVCADFNRQEIRRVKNRSRRLVMRQLYTQLLLLPLQWSTRPNPCCTKQSEVPNDIFEQLNFEVCSLYAFIKIYSSKVLCFIYLYFQCFFCLMLVFTVAEWKLLKAVEVTALFTCLLREILTYVFVDTSFHRVKLLLLSLQLAPLSLLN